ncbi:MAG: hypothetical protein R3F30_06030 [Planctomycetota bacterium]
MTLAAGCAGTREVPEVPFEVDLSWGPAAGPRTEVRLRGPDRGPLELRVRRVSAAGTWPPVPDACFGAELSGPVAARLVAGVDGSGCFDLPSVIEDPDRPAGPWLGVTIRHGARLVTLRARGRPEPALLELCGALDRSLPVRVDPWPPWLAAMRGGDPFRPGLTADPARALALVDGWRAREPGERALALDRFALLLALDRRDEAAAMLEELRADPALRGLEQELRRSLRR